MEVRAGRREVLRWGVSLAFAAMLPAGFSRPVLRPPGARPDFLARCIRCGKCVEACPFDSVRLFDLSAGGLAHTPYIDPLRTPCYLCQKRGGDGRDRPLGPFLRCGDACPTGALVTIANDKKVLARVGREYKIGVSVLDRRLCLAWQYDACGECYYNCPLRDQALRDRPPGAGEVQGAGIRPHVDRDACIGCGMCNFVCPVRRHVARAVIRRGVKLTLFEERYAGMVRNVIGRAGPGARLPAIRVVREW